ncbi:MULTISPECIES: glycosyltransferase [Okeania]|uniref:Glycosyltransferase n=1 Tax=Okeania hirsuta TaxID=1458930 RepID=A0A3N6QVM6_9CYAN|nr:MULTISPECIES: glycosyltransferase [Okeania]NEP06903.1 glycosyltransferase family 4 protein [Okeania sp. SIO4D6]NEP40767.1 glycosyltransferase family 4 protein [Okeania sp. SIO2H7]NEP74524.1 glycosyltransferase family 4 protein [Okeania sp. SIO2G5]NEP95598.1 glycosyltransferase family 4 protein [Okeania sp. SIO2F5]NEQ93339.1 glycosyltransferase family 4 protein [Okeania sp. SIO2G4]
MKLIIPIEFYRKGGVERVICGTIEELIEQVEEIILILPKKEIAYFQEKLPKSPIIKYESFTLPPKSLQSRILSVINKFSSLSGNVKAKKIQRFFKSIRRKYKKKLSIRYLANRYQATHCLYFLTNQLTPPGLDIPLAMVSHDVFWRFAPLSYPESYVRKYDLSLLEWLRKVDIVFTVSEKTRKDIISVFPEFTSKITPIPNSGFPTKSNTSQKLLTIAENSHESNEGLPIFYLPSSFGIYKDHLTLLKAGIKLAQKNLKFKIVLIGKETDNLISGNISLSQQANSQEYIDYLNQCQEISLNNQNIMQEYFEGLGYCSDEEVEKWYRKSSCVVFPSKYEGFGLALSEAVVRGLPAIVSDLEVFQEQVELYKCEDMVDFFSVGDVDALADCMEKFILHPKSKLSAEEVDKRFSHWTWRETAKEYVRLLENL